MLENSKNKLNCVWKQLALNSNIEGYNYVKKLNNRHTYRLAHLDRKSRKGFLFFTPPGRA